MTDLSLQIADRHVQTRAVKDLRHSPFVIRLKNLIDLTQQDLDGLNAITEAGQLVKRRRDLVVDGYEYCKLGFIEDGFAARYKLLRSGKRQIVNLLLPGDVVGLPGSFLDRADCSVVALTDMKLRVCALDDFTELCCRRPKFGLALSWLAMQEAAIYSEHIVDVGRRTPIERLAHFLLEIHSRLAMVGRASESAFDLPVTQEMISDALGLSVPHLNRTMARLRADGLIAVNERHVEFTDLKSVAFLAQFRSINPGRIPVPDEIEIN